MCFNKCDSRDLSNYSSGLPLSTFIVDEVFSLSADNY